MKWIKRFKLFEERYTPEEFDQFKINFELIKKYFKTRPTIDEGEYPKERLVRLCELNKFKNIYDKKAFALFNLKPFVRYEKQSDSWAGFIIKYYNETIKGSTIVMYEMKRPKGTIYFSVEPTVNRYTIYTAHFFDRYYERLIEPGKKSFSDKTREKSIMHFIKNILSLQINNDAGTIIHDNDEINIHLKGGYGAGQKVGNDFMFMTFLDTAKSSKKIITDREQYIEQTNQYKEEQDKNLTNYKPKIKKRRY